MFFAVLYLITKPRVIVVNTQLKSKLALLNCFVILCLMLFQFSTKTGNCVDWLTIRSILPQRSQNPPKCDVTLGGPRTDVEFQIVCHMWVVFFCVYQIDRNTTRADVYPVPLYARAQRAAYWIWK